MKHEFSTVACVNIHDFDPCCAAKLNEGWIPVGGIAVSAEGVFLMSFYRVDTNATRTAMQSLMEALNAPPKRSKSILQSESLRKIPPDLHCVDADYANGLVIGLSQEVAPNPVDVVPSLVLDAQK